MAELQIIACAGVVILVIALTIAHILDERRIRKADREWNKAVSMATLDELQRRAK
jgi:hypothetical protein